MRSIIRDDLIAFEVAAYALVLACAVVIGYAIRENIFRIEPQAKACPRLHDEGRCRRKEVVGWP